MPAPILWPSKPPQPPKVLVLSPPYMGESVVAAILERLGYSVYDAGRLPYEIDIWSLMLRMQDGAALSVGSSFKRATAYVGFPVAAFPESMLRMYPTAKVIILKRNAQAWYGHVLATKFLSWTKKPFGQNEPVSLRWNYLFRGLWKRWCGWETGYGRSNLGLKTVFAPYVEVSSKKTAFEQAFTYNGGSCILERAEQQAAKVRYQLHPGHLLELDMDSADVLYQMCSFLGKEVPTKAFPTKSDGLLWQDVVDMVSPRY